MKEEVEVKRPSIIATLLWTFGIIIIGLTVYCMINCRAVEMRTGATSSYL